MEGRRRMLSEVPMLTNVDFGKFGVVPGNITHLEVSGVKQLAEFGVDVVKIEDGQISGVTHVTFTLIDYSDKVSRFSRGIKVENHNNPDNYESSDYQANRGVWRPLPMELEDVRRIAGIALFGMMKVVTEKRPSPSPLVGDLALSLDLLKSYTPSQKAA